MCIYMYDGDDIIVSSLVTIVDREIFAIKIFWTKAHFRKLINY